MATDRHGPTRFSTYRETHGRVMNQFRSRDFVSSETLKFFPYPDCFRLKGEISCLGDILVTVDKLIDILSGQDDNAIVQTRWYTYNASVRGYSNILRYDNQDDDYLRDGHHDAHHKHLFDWRTGQEALGSPFWIGHQNWRTLGDVLQELENWYWQHRVELPNPEEYPDLGLR